jgi:hypothetical protein
MSGTITPEKSHLVTWLGDPTTRLDMTAERTRSSGKKTQRDTTFKGGSKKYFSPGFEGSQAVPARPSGMGMFKRR